MKTRALLLLFLLLFLCGFTASELVKTDLSSTITIPFLSVIVVLLGILFTWLKHLDDLNLTRKKDVSLNFIKFMSEYRSALISIIDPYVKSEEFHSNLLNSTRNMVGALDQFHVIAKDDISAEIELKNFEIISIMIKMNKKSHEAGDDKMVLIQWLLKEDLLSQLNVIRYQIIKLVNKEIGDSSGAEKLRKSIDKNNCDFKKLLSNTLSTADSTS
ncbi:MAG: hypothetical protein HRT55_01830 [Colwellia sp.]|uniref:hypothetical protein n=1 Tax=Alteromonadales TaxID=135622 RepID=UPI001DACAB0F|nr:MULTISPECIES: hypothetical protein [Alteromonadales]NQZ25039.1 hypothetical protein [Colwellia sp.]NRA81092.1 hypothetical protein [Pseudoalteromonas sp.]